jgi:hypothetical protein
MGFRFPTAVVALVLGLCAAAPLNAQYIDPVKVQLTRLQKSRERLNREFGQSCSNLSLCLSQMSSQVGDLGGGLAVILPVLINHIDQSKELGDGLVAQAMEREKDPKKLAKLADALERMLNGYEDLFLTCGRHSTQSYVNPAESAKVIQRVYQATEAMQSELASHSAQSVYAAWAATPDSLFMSPSMIFALRKLGVPSQAQNRSIAPDPKDVWYLSEAVKSTSFGGALELKRIQEITANELKSCLPKGRRCESPAVNGWISALFRETWRPTRPEGH